MGRSKPNKTVVAGRGRRRLRSDSSEVQVEPVEESSTEAETDTDVESSAPTPNSTRKNKKAPPTAPVTGGKKKPVAVVLSQQSQQRQQSGSQQSQGAAGGGQKELVTNALQHILISQQKKLPIKKGDLLRSINGTSKDFKVVLEEVVETLDDVFGLTLVGIKQLGDNSWEECQIDVANNFMLTSQFTRAILESSDAGKAEKDVAKDSAVRFILNSLYIANRDFDEDYIWKILLNMKLDKICSQRDDLRKFLKTEMVDPMYVIRTETKTHDEITFRYAWGIRAELECDKYEMLKHIAHTFQKPMASFKKHFDALLTDKKYEERMAAMQRVENHQASNNGNGTRRHPSITSTSGEEEDLQEIAAEDSRIVEVQEEDDEEEVAIRRPRNRNARRLKD